MSIRPVVLNGMIQRTQDVGNLKQQEDNRPIVEQQNIQIEQQKHEDQTRPIVCRIRRKRRTMAIVHDARKRASNEYEGESGRHKKRREEEPENEGKVILKGQGSHFDIKI